MAKFNFNLRDQSSNTETAIHLIVRWSNNRLVFVTGLSINPVFWETDKTKSNFQRAKTTKKFPESPEFNARLDKIEQEAKSIFMRFQNENDNQQPSIEDLRYLLNRKFNKGIENNKKDLFTFIEGYISETKNRQNEKTNRVIAASTINAYKKCFELLKKYKIDKRKRVDFDTIDLEFYHDFVEYLNKVYNYSSNTIGKYIKSLKSFMNSATERGLNTNLAYRSSKFRALSENTESIYLNEDELAEIFKIDLSGIKRLERVRDLFIVGCWTGLRFSDLSRIKSENILGDRIKIKTQKTATTVVIPIHNMVLAVMNKYKDQYDNSLPPAMSNQKMNQYLKEIGQMVSSLNSKISKSITKGGLKQMHNKRKWELITTHTARRSFATNLYLKGSIPTKDIMNITGHKTEDAFFSYIRITKDESANKIMQLWQNEAMQEVI